MRVYSLLLAVVMVQSGVGFASSTPRDKNETKRCVIFEDIEEVRKECEERRYDRQEIPWHLRDADTAELEDLVRRHLPDWEREKEGIIALKEDLEALAKPMKEAEEDLKKAEEDLKKAEDALKEDSGLFAPRWQMDDLQQDTRILNQNIDRVEAKIQQLRKQLEDTPDSHD